MEPSKKIAKEGNSKRKHLVKDFEMSLIPDTFEEVREVELLVAQGKEIMIKYKL